MSTEAVYRNDYIVNKLFTKIAQIVPVKIVPVLALTSLSTFATGLVGHDTCNMGGCGMEVWEWDFCGMEAWEWDRTHPWNQA